MGPTYLWFQLYELRELGRSFGLSDDAASTAVEQMPSARSTTMNAALTPPAEVMDLVPVRRWPSSSRPFWSNTGLGLGGHGTDPAGLRRPSIPTATQRSIHANLEVLGSAVPERSASPNAT